MNNILFEKKPSIKYQATPEAQSRFNTIVDNIDTVKLRYNNNELARRANIANAVCELSPDYKGMFEISPDAAFASFFGLEDSKSIDTMESVLKRVRQHTKDSEDALAEFKKLNREEQDGIVKEHSPNAKKKEVRAGIYGIPSSVEVDNPNYDSEKERVEYEKKLKAKNTWESYLNIRNNFSTEVVSDAMRFVQASNDRSEAAYAHIDKFLAKDFEYKEQFLSAIHAFNPEIRAGFIERVKTRIGEGWTDSGQNLRDYFVERNKDSRILYGLAEEMGLVDKDGNLTANDNQLAELQKAYETKQNVELNRSMGAMGGMGMNHSVYQNTDVKKLFDEGKKAFERTKTIRTFLDANRTKFSYDNSEWQTFENALVNGEYVLRSLVVGFGATALTKNPYAGVVATMPMMYAEEASSMYADLRFNKNIKESDAIAGALFYGTTSTLLEQLQFSRFSKFFSKGSFIPETFKQYLAYGVKEASLRLGKETGIETFVEFGQASLGFATKAWAKNHTDDFELRPLWDEYCTEVSEVFKTMPIITSLMFGFGAPFRARGYLKNVGADFGSAIKAVYTPSDVFENNVKAKGTIDLANQYFDEVKSKLGNTVSGREWLGKYFSTTTEKEKHTLLNERFSDDNERYEAKMMLDQLADIDSKATQEWVKVKIEAAKKRADEAKKILNGDATDISLFDNEVVNEKGNSSYEVFESAVDALNMRSVVDSVNTAQELSDVAGISLNEAEEIIASKGHKGFFDEKNGKIIVINSHFKNGVDALQSFVHEYGHKIMKHIRETDANGYKRMCDNVLMLVGGEDFARSLLPASYSQEGHTNYEATAQGIAEETLMRVIEQVAYKKVLDTKKRSVWEHFKGWFKKFFDEKTLADITNEELADMALNVLQREKAFDVSLPSKPSKNWRAKTPEADGAEVGGEWSVIDASELLASTDKGYDDALQPRNRSRQSSKEQVLSIANNLDPERLDNDPTTSDGAPIIDDRNMVVSGNGRILAIRLAYESGKADDYRRHVQNRAKAMGVDIPKNIKNPVLVRKVNNTGEMSIEELAARSNKSSVAGMSVAEQAVADGRRIIENGLLEMFYPSADGNILAESNRDFNNAFLDIVGGGELYRNKDGSLRANLAPRVKAGVLAAMLNNDGNRDIVERLLDNPEGYSALINGLMQCAANVAELTQKPMYDIAGDLSQAVELYIEMHEKGQTVAEFSAQMDMFREKPSDEVMFLCKLFEDNQRTSSGISGVLKEYASQCKKIDTATANLFGDEDPSKFDKLQSAYNHYATDIANQDTGANLKAKEVEETTQKKFNASYNIKDRRVYFYDRKDIPDLMLYNIQNKLTLHSEKDKPILKDEEKDNLRQNTKIIIEKLKAQTGPNIIEELFDIDDRTINAIKSFYDYYNLDNPIKDGKHFITKEIFSHSKKHQELQGFNDEVLLIEEDFYLIGEILKSWDYISFRRRKTTNTITFEKIYDDVVVFLTEEIRTGRRQQGQNKLAVLTIYKREELASRGSNDTTNLINEHRHPNSSDTTQSENNTGSQQNSSLKAKYDETRSQEEIDELNAKFRDLYEQYKNGAQDAYKQAVELLKAEAERKGYVVKVYHGTGADRFNVADATSKHEENGEGNQAHGAGLYMAVSRDVSEAYKNAKTGLTIKGQTLNQALRTSKGILSDLSLKSIGYDSVLQLKNALERIAKNGFDRELNRIEKKYEEVKGTVFEEVAVASRNNILAIRKLFKKKGISENDLKYSKGTLFNWLTNLNDDNTLDVDKPLTEQGESVRKAIFEYYKSRPDDYMTPKDIDDLNAYQDGGRFYKDVIFQMRREGASNPKLEASKLLARLGIKGLTYDGRQDGRCYVSFEGGSTVKLQDPFTFDDNGNLIPLTKRFDEDNPDMRWKFDDEMPSPEDIIEAKRQYDEIVAKYKGTPQWMKAPNGEPTNLTEEQWVMVRTPNFKNFFGDWETLAIINEVESMPAMQLISPTKAYSDNKEIKELFKTFGVVENKKNGNKTRFAGSTVGKIVGHKNIVPLSEVLDSFKSLFETSILAIEEKEVLKEGHKQHSNFVGYEHYVNKFTYQNNVYYIRFTVAVENVKPHTLRNGYIPRNVHSSMITNVSIYSESPQSKSDLSTSGTKGAFLIDDKLSKFLSSVNKKDVSKVVDDNGEPLVVYHGTSAEFTTFKKGRDSGMHFGTLEQATNRSSRNIMPVFLNIRNPKRTHDKMDGQAFEIKKAKKSKFDGLIYRNIFEGEGDSYVAFKPNQIKSATDNVGTFSQSNDIRWKVDEQIETPQFKEWFGNSKVVEENVKPLHVYHGTNSRNADYSIFDVFKGKYHFFTSNKDVASSMGSYVYDVFLRIENPLIIDANGNTFGAIKDHSGGIVKFKDLTATQKKKLCKAFDLTSDELEQSYKPESKIDLVQAGVIKRPEKSSDEWAMFAKTNGYDGVIFKNLRDGAGLGELQKTSDVYVVFDSVQIKDATGKNNGDFSLENPSIKWKVDAKVEADAWASNPENVRKSAEEYLSKQKRQIVVDPDEIRKLVPNYDISDNSAFVSAGDEILEVVWAEALKRAPKGKPVVLLTGNPAAGKGTAKEDGLLKDAEKANLVFDAPQNSFESVEKRVKEAIDAGHKILLIQIYNDPITSWENSLKRGIEKGRYLPLKYFVERAYERAQGKVAKIENELKSKYGEKFNTIYVDSTKNNPILVSPKEALAWDYSISDEQLKQIENITYEYKKQIQESSRIRKDKSNPFAVITSGLREGFEHFVYRNVSFGRIVPEGISRRDKQSNEGTSRRGRSSESETRLKSLLRQERSENPVYWASIVLAKEILRGRAITGAKLEKVLPSGKFDGTQRQYAIDRAKLIAEQCKATQEDYINRLDQAVKLAENDVYWTRDIVQEMNNSFRRDGEEYGIVRQKLTQWLKDEQRKDLEKVKGLTSSELGIDVAEAIENALEAEPERKKSESSVEEETEEEVSDDAEEGIDNELVGAVEKLAPSNIREIISKVRIGVLKAVKAKGGDEQTRRRVYRNTLVEVLREATKQLTYGKEREAIFAKISELATKGYAVIKIKDGERAGQKIDNYTLRAEHIALRIFNRGVRDTKEALLEKFEKLLKHAKAPARIKRDDKRKMTGKSEERAYIIKQIAYMPLNSDDKTVKSVESEIENTLSVINKADSSMANDYHAKLINAVQYLEDLQRFGALKEKSRAEMAEAIEWIEKFLESETEQHAEKVEKLKEDADRRRKIFLDAINENDHNANFDGKVRESFRYLLNSGSTFRDLLLGLGRSATGEKSSKFRQLVNDMMNDCYRATAEKENEVFKFQNELTEVVKEIYGMDASDAFKHLLGSNEKLQEFSIQGKPMSVQIALQRLSMAEQRNYEHNVYIHCCGRSKEAKAIEQRIDELEQQKAETTDFEVLKQIRADIKKLENELEAIERNSVAEYVEKLRSSLSEQDLKLLDWFREFYSREREHLSDANEVITGLGVPEADPLYTPMKMLREGGTNEKHQVVAIVPKSLSPRVPNALDMDENIGIVDIWNERIAENAHYKAFSQLNIEWRGIFAHADFHKAVNTKLGKNVLTQVLDHFNDIMSVSALGGLTIDTIDKLNGLYAIAALGFNLGSGLRQMTGASAFANFVGAKNTFKYAKDCLSKEGRQASIEILKSDIAKRRMQSGNNQVLLEALNNIEDNKFWAWYKRNAMFFNRWGDILPILTIGQGIYRSKTEEYANSMPIEQAKQKAMDEMWAIAEASQQSPSVMNMGTWQRRGGSFGKAAGLFISSPQLMLSREVEVFNRFVSVRKKYKNNPKDESIRKDYFEARKMLAKTFFINHVLVQGGYMVATALWKALLGDDWDDDDCWAILAETIAGPLGGLVVFGRFVSAFYSNYSVSAMPIEGFGRTVKASVDLVQDLIMLDGEEITKDLDRIAKSLFAPYRDGRKIYKNATDDKDGLVW